MARWSRGPLQKGGKGAVDGQARSRRACFESARQRSSQPGFKRSRQGGMAFDLDTPEGRRDAIATLEPDLHGLLERKHIPEAVQAALADKGIKALSRFSSIADDKAEVRTFCREVLRLDRVNGAADIAGVVDAWGAAQTRMEVRHKAEAEADLTGIPQLFSQGRAARPQGQVREVALRAGGERGAVERDAGASMRPDRGRRAQGAGAHAGAIARGCGDGGHWMHRGQERGYQDPQRLQGRGKARQPRAAQAAAEASTWSSATSTRCAGTWSSWSTEGRLWRRHCRHP